MNSKDLTDRDLAEAIARVTARLMKIGWIDRNAISEGMMHIGYTRVGLERMNTLKAILLGEIDSALTYAEYLALYSLLLTLDLRLPMLDEDPE